MRYDYIQNRELELVQLIAKYAHKVPNLTKGLDIYIYDGLGVCSERDLMIVKKRIEEANVE